MPASNQKGAERHKQMQVIPYSETDFFQGDTNIYSISEADLLLYEQMQIFLADFGTIDDDPYYEACTNDSRAEPRDLQPDEEMRPYAIPSASLEILRSRIGAVDGGGKGDEATSLSVCQVIEASARNLIHSNAGTGPESEDIRLVQNLMSCAEEVSNHHYDCAGELLEELSKLIDSSPTNNVTQRLVYYFTDALRAKIELRRNMPPDVMPPISSTSTFLEKLPFNQAVQFGGIQATLDHVASSRTRSLHVIDLGLHCSGGLRHAILMQTLASASECSLEHLKVTAVATPESNAQVEDAGVRLRHLAESSNLSFSFDVISLEEFLNLRHQAFLSLDLEETVVVQAAHALRFMVPNRNQLENLMTVIRRINPRAMIMTEVEASFDSPVFVNRFVEALLFFGSGFDYVGRCLKNDLTERGIVESEIFSPSIRHIVAAEEEERKFRIVGINIWREIFAEFGMVEADLSKLALNHANSVLNMFECRDSCKIGLNGKSLIVGWKDTPIFSLSAWKFEEKGSK